MKESGQIPGGPHSGLYLASWLRQDTHNVQVAEAASFGGKPRQPAPSDPRRVTTVERPVQWTHSVEVDHPSEPPCPRRDTCWGLRFAPTPATRRRLNRYQGRWGLGVEVGIKSRSGQSASCASASLVRQESQRERYA